MNQKTASKSSLFLIELILSILIFSIASVICIQLFVKAHTLSQDSRELNQAVIKVESAAEVMRSETSPESVYSQFQVRSDILYLYYDSNWELCDQALAIYTVSISPFREDSYESCQITASKSDKTLYELSVSKYQRSRK